MIEQASPQTGRGSDTALAVPILKAVVACHNGVATFAEAGVSGKA